MLKGSEKGGEDLSKWTPSLIVEFKWCDKLVAKISLRRDTSTHELQDKIFDIMKKNKFSDDPHEKIPKKKEDIFFVVGGTRIPPNSKCVVSDVTDILSKDISKGSVYIRVHNVEGSFMSSTKEYKRSESEKDLRGNLLIKKFDGDGFYEDDQNVIYQVSLKGPGEISFYQVSEENKEGSVGPIIAFRLSAGSKAICQYTRIKKLEEDVVLQLCSRRSTGGMVLEEEITVTNDNSGVKFEVEKDGAYLVRKYKVRIGLKLDVSRLAEKFDMDYSDKEGTFERGGKPYTLPTGFKRIGIRLPSFREYEKWCVAFHGTNQKACLSIIRDGLLRPLNTPSAMGTMLKPPPNHYSLEKKVYGIEDFPNAIFVSPNFNYASCDVYAPSYIFNGRKYKIIFQVRVKPGSFTEHRSTTADKFNDELVEWRIPDPKDVVVYGLLYKEI